MGDANATGGATNYWEVVSTPFGTGGTHTGSWKGYCARTKYGQSSTAPSPTYDNDMTSFMQRNIDLTGCGCATLEFWAFIPSIETCCDYLRVLVELQEVVRSPSETGGWIKINVDLNRAASRKQFPISFFQNPNQGSS